MTARHPLPSTTVSVSCQCMWSKNIDKQEFYNRTYTKPILVDDGDQNKNKTAVAITIVYFGMVLLIELIQTK